MSKLQQMWNDANSGATKKSGSKYTPVPDGEHTALINDYGISQNEGKAKALYLKLYFPAFGEEETAYYSIPETGDETWAEGALTALASLFRGLKIKCESLDEVDEVLYNNAVTGWTLKVKKVSKTKGGKTYRNYYVNDVIDKSVPDTKATNLKDEDVPF